MNTIIYFILFLLNCLILDISLRNQLMQFQKIKYLKLNTKKYLVINTKFNYRNFMNE
jgi:hypothetical protein